jgi:hypothetical protein
MRTAIKISSPIIECIVKCTALSAIPGWENAGAANRAVDRNTSSAFMFSPSNTMPARSEQGIVYQYLGFKHFCCNLPN